MKMTLRMGPFVLLALILSAPVTGQAAWQLVWSDEFSQPDGASPDSTKWNYDVGGPNPNNELEYYTSRTNNARIVGGQLVIEAKQETTYPGYNYTSARMKTQDKWTWTYGRIEGRIKIPKGQGIWPSIWMLGASISSVSWPACGEIDIMENIGKTSDQGTTHGTIHGPMSTGGDYNGGAGVGGTYTLPGGALLSDAFHIYAVEWTTNQIKFYLDNVNYFTVTPASLPSGGNWVFTAPQFVLLNVAVGGNWPGSPDGTTVFPQQMLVDYVRVYKYVSVAPSAPTGLTASAGDTEVYLNWTASTNDPAGYNVWRAASSGGPYVNIGNAVNNNYTDAGVSGCSTYYYVVTATNSLGSSPNSNEATAAVGAFALAVNSGGSATGQFGADAYFSGGTASVTAAAIDTSGLVAPAPQGVYQSERYGPSTYTFTGLITGEAYKVRLHFAEIYFTSAGQRSFNVFINGTQVLTNFDIFAAAGAENKATIREFTAIATGGQITVQYANGAANLAKSSGIELLLAKPGAPAGLVPVPGDSQVALQWNSVAGATYAVKRAPTSGGIFTPVFSGLAATHCTDSGLTNGVTYYYAVSASILGCESTNSAMVSATPACSPPAAPAAGNNSPIWTGMTLNLTAASLPGATYSWTGPRGFTSTNQNPSILNASTNDSGVYSVSAAMGSCSSAPAATLATVNPPAAVAVQPVGGSLILTWPSGILQSGTNLTGPWGDVGGAVSPFTNPATEWQQFYRIKLQ